MILTFSYPKHSNKNLTTSLIVIFLIGLVVLITNQIVFTSSAKLSSEIVLFSEAELNAKASDVIEEKCKSSINQEFPEDFLQKTLREIKKLAQSEGELARKAKKAWKLLTDNRFRK